jgi:hypothetical protein
MPISESVAVRADPVASWTGPLFIIGMPRSGTKLLRGLLEQHPRVRVPTIETEFFPFLVRWARLISSGARRRRSRLTGASGESIARVVTTPLACSKASCATRPAQLRTPA